MNVRDVIRWLDRIVQIMGSFRTVNDGIGQDVLFISLEAVQNLGELTHLIRENFMYMHLCDQMSPYEPVKHISVMHFKCVCINLQIP